MQQVDLESSIAEPKLVTAAQQGDTAAFERLVDPHRRSLHAFCYRMLGSLSDADDALQDTLVGAWRGMGRFEKRSSPRSWLFAIATNACRKLAQRRPRRILSPDYGPARTDVHNLGEPVTEPIWLEPYPGPEDAADPASVYEQRESLELAFVWALQHLPPAQRAVLILREVLQLSAAEVAVALDTTVPAVNSALQRARKTVSGRIAAESQQEERGSLGAEGQRKLAARFIAAWESADVDALVRLLAEEARFSMPPFPAWFSGREIIGRLLAERIFTRSWQLLPVEANGQLAFACYEGDGSGPFSLDAILAISVRQGRISEMVAFLEHELYERFGIPAQLSAPYEKTAPR